MTDDTGDFIHSFAGSHRGGFRGAELTSARFLQDISLQLDLRPFWDVSSRLFNMCTQISRRYISCHQHHYRRIYIFCLAACEYHMGRKTKGCTKTVREFENLVNGSCSRCEATAEIRPDDEDTTEGSTVQEASVAGSYDYDSE